MHLSVTKQIFIYSFIFVRNLKINRMGGNNPSQTDKNTYIDIFSTVEHRLCVFQGVEGGKSIIEKKKSSVIRTVERSENLKL